MTEEEKAQVEGENIATESVKLLEDAYQYLELHAMNDGMIFHPFLNSGRLLNNLYNQRKEEGADAEELSKINCECQVFMMGDPENPTKNTVIKETDYEYLKKRVDDTQNPLLKSRYAHLLVHCDIRDKYVYAQIAVQEYLKLIRIYEEKPEDVPGGWRVAIEWSIKNALELSAKFNLKICQDNVKKEIKKLIFQETDPDSTYSILILDMINLMLEQNMLFKKDDFEGMDEICIRHANILRKSGKNFPRSAIELYEIGQKIEGKLGTKKHDWNLYIAETYEELCQAFEKNPLVALDECQKAKMHYKLAKKSVQEKQIEQKIQELKKEIVIPIHHVEIQDEEHKKYLEASDSFVDKLTEENPEAILEFLIYSPNLILDIDVVMKGVDTYLETSLARHLFNNVLFDQFGNRAQVFNTENEKKVIAKNNLYRLFLRQYPYYLLHKIVIESVKKGKLSPEIISNYLQTHSWYGKSFPKYIPTGESVAFKWLNQIMPAIEAFFSSLSTAIESEEETHFILPIDSLTLKFEGIFRDYCAFNGITPTYQKNGQNDILEQEKNLNNLLYDDYAKVVKIFGQDETEFFKFLFVEKNGHNLRNNIAHSLLFEHQYSIYYMNLVFLAILRLSRGNFREEDYKEDSTENPDDPDTTNNGGINDE